MKLRVGIAVGPGPVQEALREVVEEDPGRELAWTAPGPTEAASWCSLDTPGLLLLGLDERSVEATRRIMAISPTTILVVAAADSADTGRVFDVLASGARDVVEPPRRRSGGALENVAPLRAKLALLARLAAPAGSALPERADRAEAAPAFAPLVAVGASTGGPGAVGSLLAALPTDLGAPVVVVQHLDDPFVRGLAEWLTSRAGRSVRTAVGGERPRPGDVLLAGTSAHLVVSENGSLAYTPEPRDCPYRPSVDAFFSSAARSWPGKGVAVLLTGMGRDGAEGLLACRTAGWHTIAQDEKTSVLYGMPRAAREIGAATEVLPLPDIAPAVARRVREERNRSRESGGIG